MRTGGISIRAAALLTFAALCVLPVAAWAEHNYEFDDELIRDGGASKVDYGTGQGVAYAPGTEYIVLSGYANQYGGYQTNGQIMLGHTSGAGPGGTTDIMAPCDESGVPHTFGEGRMFATFLDFRPEVYWGWQDADHTYVLDFATLYRRNYPSGSDCTYPRPEGVPCYVGGTDIAFGFRNGDANGVTWWVEGWADDLGLPDEHKGHKADDIYEISISWDPANDSVTLGVLWTDKDRTIDKMTANTDPATFAPTEITFSEPGLHDSGAFAAAYEGIGLLDRMGFEVSAVECHIGDANGDGEVGIADLSALADNYGVTSGATWQMGDFNDDGEVGIADLSALADNYGWTGDPCTPATVPEPAVVAVMLLGAAGLLRRRRQA